MTGKREMKDRVYETIAAIGKALASPKRLEILALLTQGEKSVEALAEQTDMNFKLTSAHLKALKTSRLVDSRRDGKRVFYRISGKDVASFWVTLKSLAERQFSEIQATLDDFFQDHETMTQLDRRDLLRRARAGEVLVIDVRPVDEYQAGHLPSSKSIPMNELKRRVADIPKNVKIVAYCRGPYCVLSHEAVEFLRKSGYKAQRLADGVSEWMAAGLPIQRGLAG